MGRGNVCVRGESEGLFYVDYNNFSADDHGLREWEESLEELKHDIIKMFPSFSECSIWLSRGEHAVLENGLFFIAVEDNEWSAAVKLLQKEEDYDIHNRLDNLQGHRHTGYLEGIKKCLFRQFRTIGVYSGPWTSGTIDRPEVQREGVV